MKHSIYLFGSPGGIEHRIWVYWHIPLRAIATLRALERGQERVVGIKRCGNSVGISIYDCENHRVILVAKVLQERKSCLTLAQQCQYQSEQVAHMLVSKGHD